MSQPKDLIDSNDNAPRGNHIKEMIMWWEYKRVFYNIPIIGWIVYIGVDILRFSPEREVPVLGIAIFILELNLCYTLGWLSGLVNYYLFRSYGFNNTGRWILFALGTIFSILVALIHVPSLFGILV